MNKLIEERTRRTEWYRDARFGMFIHWGLYAIPARGEWVRSRERIKKEDYDYLMDFHVRIMILRNGQDLQKRPV